MQVADVFLGIRDVSGNMRVSIGLQVDKLGQLIDVICDLTVTVPSDLGGLLRLCNLLLELCDDQLVLPLLLK